MQRSRIRIQAGVAAALLTALSPQLAKGDGGVVLLHEAKGPFSVTVFVVPEMTPGGLTDVSVLVQSRTNGDVVLDASVEFSIEPARDLTTTAESEPVCGASSAFLPAASPVRGSSPEFVPGSREQASNKLLYAAGLNLGCKGDCRLHVYVSRRTDKAQFVCLIPVIQAPANAAGLWPYLLIPPIAIAVFAMNQKLRRHSLEEDPNSQSVGLSGNRPDQASCEPGTKPAMQ